MQAKSTPKPLPATLSAEQLAKEIGKDAATDRLVAKHPNAAAETLLLLARSKDKTTRKLVALNPGTPKLALLDLAPQFPGDFFRNPAFDLLLMEDPDLVFQLGRGVLKNILKRPDCPESFMRWAVTNGDEAERLAVAMNSEATADLLRQLISLGGEPGKAAAQHAKVSPGLPSADLESAFTEAVQFSLGELDVETAKRLWRSGAIGAAQWLHLRPDVRLAVPWREDWRAGGWNLQKLISHLLKPSTSLESLPYLEDRARGMAQRWRRDLIKLAAARGSDSDNVVAHLTDDSLLVVRFHEEMTAVLLAPGQTLMARILGARTDNPLFLEEEHSRSAARSSVRAVRLRGLAHSQADPQALLKACRSTDWVERLAAARNPAAPTKVLASLATDTNVTVSAQAGATAVVKTEREQLLARSVQAALVFDCRPVVAEITRLLREFTASAAYITIGTSWWDRLGIAQRLGCSGLFGEARELGSTFELLSPQQRHALLSRPFREEYLINFIPSRPDMPELFEALSKSSVDSDRMKIAGSEYTKESMLAALATDKNTSVRISVACNPRSPPDALKRLSRNSIFREEVAGNISAPPDVLEVLSRDKSTSVRRAVAANLSAQGLLETLSRDQSELVRRAVRCAVAANPSAPENVLWLKESDDVSLCSSILVNELAPEALRTAMGLRLAQMHADESANRKENSEAWGNWFRLAAEPLCPAEILTILSADPKEYVRESALGNPNCPLEVLQAATDDPTASIRRAVGGNPAAPVEVLVILAADSDESVRMVVAKNASCPLELFEKLAADPSVEVRAEIAHLTKHQLRSLHHLATDSSTKVRIALARNRHIASAAHDMLWPNLAGDTTPDGHVCLAMVQNPAVSEEILAALATTKDFPALDPEYPNRGIRGEIFKELAAHRRTPPQYLSTLGYPTIVSANPSTPTDVLDDLARSPYAEVRRKVAANASTSAATLSGLAQDSDHGVRVTVAGRQTVHPDVLARMAEEHDFDIHGALAMNAATPEAALIELAHTGAWTLRFTAITHRNFPADRQDDALSALRADMVRAINFSDECAPDAFDLDALAVPLAWIGRTIPTDDPAALAKAVKHKDWLTRLAALLTGALKPGQIKRLADDDNESVRTAALIRLQAKSTVAES